MEKQGKRKRKNLNYARNMDVDQWRDRNVAKRTREFFLRTEGIVPTEDTQKYRAEYARQEKLFRLERKAMKTAKNAGRGNNVREYAQREAAWRMEHEKDSDEELLTYLHDAVADVDPLPETMDVTGGVYIAGRFGGWRLALFLAGVPLPQNAALPSQEELDEARRRMDARRAERENG